MGKWRRDKGCGPKEQRKGEREERRKRKTKEGREAMRRGRVRAGKRAQLSKSREKKNMFKKGKRKEQGSEGEGKNKLFQRFSLKYQR